MISDGYYFDGYNTAGDPGSFVQTASYYCLNMPLMSDHPGGTHVAMADGSVHFESQDLDALVLKALTTRAGQDTIESNP